MLRAKTIIRRAAVRPERVADTVALAHAARHLAGEVALQGATLAFAAVLPKPTEIEDGDALRLEDGRLVLVRAAEEPLLTVRAGTPARLLRLAWQLGSNHVPMETADDALHVPDTPVVAELVRGLGGAAEPVVRPFRPERAVHAHDHATCGHDHGDHHAGHTHHHDGHHHEEHAHDHAHHAHAGHDHAHGKADHAPHDDHHAHDHEHG